MRLSIFYQRLEGLAILVASVWLYLWLNYKWYWLVIFILAVDVFAAGYLINKRVGAHIYNIGHGLTLPTILAASSVVFGWHFLLGLSLIWLAHIGMDRLAGYGLKEADSFQNTHLGHIGKKK